MKKSQTMTVLDEVIRVTKEDFISLTDMLRSKDGTFFISDWLRNRNTIEYLGIWERIHNPDFNYGEFDLIKSQAGLNSYKISVKEWVAKTNAIGLQAKAGRYGGTYAHADIAFEFGMWISAEFKIYLVKEFQRLKTEEQQQLGWDVKRQLTKINYRIHTDAVKESLIPAELTPPQINLVYASEADLLNMALFGITAKHWRTANPDLKGNIRDHATMEQLVVLSNLESINAVFIRQKIPATKRLPQLNQIAITQMTSLIAHHSIKKLSIRDTRENEGGSNA